MAWADRVKQAPTELRREFERRNKGELPVDWKRAIEAARAEFLEKGGELATRQASGKVLDHLFDAIPELLGGSADLTPSNNTKAKNQIEIKPGDFKGSYVHYGVREHGMAAAMNGLASRRPDSLRRHVYVLFGLLPARHPPCCDDAHPDDLRYDARFDRPWRGWPYSPTRRAPCGAARDPAPERVPARRCSGDG